MAGATIWKGHIRFREFDVPVKLHSAVREEHVGFHLLHAADRARLRQQMLCALEKRPVPAEEQTRGFEVEDGKYVLMDAAELDRLVPESSRTIEVREFVGSGRIDPLFIERTYTLEPDSAVAAPSGYGSLVKVLDELRVSGICSWTMRKRSYLGALQTAGDSLRLSTLRFADEIVPAAALGLQEVPVTEKELAIGSELIDKLTAPFDPRKFENEHRRKLLEMIEKKARGEKIAVLSPRRLEPTEPDSLLEMLEASLKKAA